MSSKLGAIDDDAFVAWLTRADLHGILLAVERSEVNVGTDCRWPDLRRLATPQRLRAREAAIELVIGLGGEWAAPDGTTWTARPGWLSRRIGIRDGGG